MVKISFILQNEEEYLSAFRYVLEQNNEIKKESDRIIQGHINEREEQVQQNQLQIHQTQLQMQQNQLLIDEKNNQIKLPNF